MSVEVAIGGETNESGRAGERLLWLCYKAQRKQHRVTRSAGFNEASLTSNDADNDTNNRSEGFLLAANNFVQKRATLRNLVVEVLLLYATQLA